MHLASVIMISRIISNTTQNTIKLVYLYVHLKEAALANI